MARKKMSLLNGMNFEQLLDRMGHEMEQIGLREAERKSLPPKIVRVPQES